MTERPDPDWIARARANAREGVAALPPALKDAAERSGTAATIEDLPDVDVAPNPLPDLEGTLRVLYHVVETYQTWRPTELGVPNEFTDDAIRIGEQHLHDLHWWPTEGDYPNENES